MVVHPTRQSGSSSPSRLFLTSPPVPVPSAHAETSPATISLRTTEIPQLLARSSLAFPPLQLRTPILPATRTSLSLRSSLRSPTQARMRTAPPFRPTYLTSEHLSLLPLHTETPRTV